MICKKIGGGLRIIFLLASDRAEFQLPGEINIRKDRARSEDFSAHPTGLGTVGGMLPQGFTLSYFRFLPTGEVTSGLHSVASLLRRGGFPGSSWMRW